MAAAAAAGWCWLWGWGRRCPGRPGLPGPGPGPITRLLFLLLLGPVTADITDGNSEHLKREHSLIKPYQGVGSSSTLFWDFQGSTILTSQYLRLTPDERSKEGSIWNHLPCFLKDWEMHVHFKVHGAGKKNLHGDGIALWYTRDRMVPGPVFGSKDNFHGLAIFLDTYPNDETTERVFPYISVMVNNGSLSYDHSKDGRWTELAGCTADLRNRNHDTFLAVRYSRGRLTVMTDLEDKNEWKNCIDITGVRLPTGYYFGASAGTGDLSDNHDIISMKLFQLMVEHTPDEENIDWTKIEPSVNFLKSPKGLRLVSLQMQNNLCAMTHRFACVSPTWTVLQKIPGVLLALFDDNRHFLSNRIGRIKPDTKLVDLYQPAKPLWTLWSQTCP